MSATRNRLATPAVAREAGIDPVHVPMQRLAGVLRRLWAAYWAYQLHRATVHMLRTLDDRTLKDIGLTRREIETAFQSTRGAIFDPGRERAPYLRAP